MSQQDNTWPLWGPVDNITQRGRYKRRMTHVRTALEEAMRNAEGALACTFHKAYSNPGMISAGTPADKVLIVTIDDDRYTGPAKYGFFAFNGRCEPRVQVTLPSGESKHYAAASVFPAPDDTPVPEWALTPTDLPAMLCEYKPHQQKSICPSASK